MIRILVVAVTLLAGALGLAACDDDGDDELSTEEYFRRLQELEDRFEDRSDEIDEAIGDVFDAELTDETREDIEQYLADASDAIDDYREDLDDLDPPEEAEDAHERAVEGAEELRETFEDWRDRLEDADSVEELFEDADIDALERLSDACSDLEELAQDNGIDVELNCEELE